MHFQGTNTYAGAGTDTGASVSAGFLEVLGSSAAPDTTANALAIIQKRQSGHVGGYTLYSSYSSIYKTGTANASGDRATSFFTEAIDKVGGSGTFIEGTRSHAILASGTSLGGAYGAVFVAGDDDTSTTHNYLIGAESDIYNRASDAPSTFDANAFTASFNASSDGVHTVDAAYIVNPFVTSAARWRRGFFVPQGQTNAPIVDAAFESDAQGGTWGVNLTLSTPTNAIGIPNNSPIVAMNAAGSATLQIMSLWNDNSLRIGIDSRLAGIVIGSGSPAPFAIIGSSIYSGSSPGVSCSGTPTSSFATVNGIVTHC